MTSFFISANSLSELCQDEMTKSGKEQSDWFLILTKQRQLFVDSELIDSLTQTDPLFIFSESYGVRLEKSAVDFNKAIVDSPDIVLDYPQCIFLLDVSQHDADILQSRFGVLCHSTADWAECPLSATDCSFELIDGQLEHSWTELFEGNKACPSNSLIIIDRFLFSYDGNNRLGVKDSLRNIKQILKGVLPNTLDCDYHVLILFNKETSNDRDFVLDECYDELVNYVDNELDLSYTVQFEFFTVAADDPRYSDTHNRQIISNYFIASALYNIRAFDAKGRATCTQNINVKYLYSKGLHDRSDSPVKMINRLVESIYQMREGGNNIVKLKLSGHKEYLYYSDDGFQTLDNMFNRIVINSNNKPSANILHT